MELVWYRPRFGREMVVGLVGNCSGTPRFFVRKTLAGMHVTTKACLTENQPTTLINDVAITKLVTFRVSRIDDVKCILVTLVCLSVSPFPQIDIIGVVLIVWRVRGKIIRSVLCNIVCNNCAQCNAHTYEQTNRSLDWVFVSLGPFHCA